MLFTTKVARLIYEWKIENDKIEEKIKNRGKQGKIINICPYSYHYDNVHTQVLLPTSFLGKSIACYRTFLEFWLFIL